MKTVENNRKQLLRKLNQMAKEDIEKFIWSTSGDEKVCPKCRARALKSHTLEELKTELEKDDFCGNFGNKKVYAKWCRCVILADY